MNDEEFELRDKIARMLLLSEPGEVFSAVSDMAYTSEGLDKTAAFIANVCYTLADKMILRRRQELEPCD